MKPLVVRLLPGDRGTSSRHFCPGEPHAQKSGQGTRRREATTPGAATLSFSRRPKHTEQEGTLHTAGRTCQHIVQGVNKGSFSDLRLLPREIKVINIKTSSWYMPQFKVNSLSAFPWRASPQTTAGLGAGRKSSVLTADSQAGSRGKGGVTAQPLEVACGLWSSV